MTDSLLDPDQVREQFTRLRRRLGWTKAETARRLGVHQTTPGKWESGETQIADRHLIRIARAAGEDPSVFFPRPDDEGDDDRRERLIAARWMRKLADQLEAEATPPGEVVEAAESDARRAAQLLEGKMGRQEQSPGA